MCHWVFNAVRNWKQNNLLNNVSLETSPMAVQRQFSYHKTEVCVGQNTTLNVLYVNVLIAQC